jgi:hypothetical protein
VSPAVASRSLGLRGSRRTPTWLFGRLLVVGALLVAEARVRVVPVHVLSRPLEELLIMGGLQVPATLADRRPHAPSASLCEQSQGQVLRGPGPEYDIVKV